MRKGMVFSLDVMVALLLAVIFTTFIFFNVNQFHSNYDEVFLHKSAIDTLSVLREDYALENFDNASIQNFLKNMPIQYCVNVTVYDFKDEIVYNSLRVNCSSAGEVVGISRRVFLINSTSIYLGEVKTWYE